LKPIEKARSESGKPGEAENIRSPAFAETRVVYLIDIFDIF
jgi:hypothetical protein